MQEILGKAAQRIASSLTLWLVLACCGDPIEPDLLAEPALEDHDASALSWPALRREHVGAEVALAQRLLALRGFAAPQHGHFDAATEHALRRWQAAWRLPQSGVIGNTSWPRLVRWLDSAAPPELIAGAQAVLAEAGAPLSVTGELDAATSSALRELQATSCLVPTGELGLWSQSALLSGQRFCAGAPLGELPLARVAALARDAGVPCGEALATAVAIAAAESRATTNAIGQNGPTAGCAHGSLDVGLWQINDCYHPEIDRRCAVDAACNARAMSAISRRGRDFTPWTTFRNGAYDSQLAAAREATASVCQ